MGRKVGNRSSGQRTSGNRRSARSAVRSKKPGEYNGEDFDDLVKQMQPLGLQVKKMEADGNCLFRAFADQILGDSEEHMQFRDECCDYMEEHAGDFEVFHADEDFEDSESFQDYVQHMRSPCRWGSQLEMMALCQRHVVNAIVHQAGRPPYEMVFAPLDAKCIQLSYHDGEHYNSIRFAGDTETGKPASCLSLKQVRGELNEEESPETQHVRESLPPDFCVSLGAIRAALVQCGGDTDAAAEALLQAEYLKSESSGGAAREDTLDRNAAEVSSTTDQRSNLRATETSGEAPTRPASRSSKADKRSEKKKAKEEKERRRKADHSKGEPCAEEDEALSILAKSLITV
eukprot:gnl/MRDRNA2_/MRDRNA2_97746_c0_seq1.p1 gnl/MRDRNA2_/MRDRNA2_97746_c0~~gnl/MRDRNA2_/MRDRNA2_97746_c0_seq1.p1  ORF type:complete len:345 (+),score=79.64 gnl/MRDRNA2_/MRDRNA2_97746_c0_seq1:83-1117(+)